MLFTTAIHVSDVGVGVGRFARRVPLAVLINAELSNLTLYACVFGVVHDSATVGVAEDRVVGDGDAADGDR